MARKKKSTSPDGFPDKSWNLLSDSWRTSAQSMQTEDLEKDLIKAVRNMSNTNFDMKNDSKLKALQEEVKELKSFYTETISAERAKVDFCVYLLNSRGVTPPKTETDEDEEASS